MLPRVSSVSPPRETAPSCRGPKLHAGQGSELCPILETQPAVIGMIVVDDDALIRVEKRTLQIIGHADAMLVTL
jgi:hypothetical protein